MPDLEVGRRAPIQAAVTKAPDFSLHVVVHRQYPLRRTRLHSTHSPVAAQGARCGGAGCARTASIRRGSRCACNSRRCGRSSARSRRRRRHAGGWGGQEGAVRVLGSMPMKSPPLLLLLLSLPVLGTPLLLSAPVPPHAPAADIISAGQYQCRACTSALMLCHAMPCCAALNRLRTVHRHPQL